jgi:hypothetical protein
MKKESEIDPDNSSLTLPNESATILLHPSHQHTCSKIPPSWEGKRSIDSELGQKLLVPSSSSSKLIAKSKLLNYTFCVNNILVKGPYEIIEERNCKVILHADLEWLKGFSQLCSEYCEESMKTVWIT